MVSKSAVLLTEWVFEGDLVSKMPHLLTEWVFEGDLVSKMADLLTEKGAERGRCYPHSVATIIGVRRGYHHSYAISKSRAGVSAGLGGFVGFRQLPRWPGECDRFANIAWPSGNERPTGVTAKNLRSRRPSFWPAPEAHAPLARNRERGAKGMPHAKASQAKQGWGRGSTYLSENRRSRPAMTRRMSDHGRT
jgi:hypothetical protein